MISRILSTGDKVDIVHGQKEHQYKSKIMDILDEETLRLSVPMEGNVIVPLEKGARLSLTFFSGRKLYSCRGEITDRYKEDKLYLMVVRLTSELERIQRRQFYRLAHSMEIEFKELLEEETPAAEELPWNTGTTLDISGGGCRFNSAAACTAGEKLELRFFIKMASGTYEQNWIGKVTASVPVPNRADVFETRVEFLGEERRKREQLVKFIFEEERKIRQKERGMDT